MRLSGATDVFRITDQNGNMVATLSNRTQAETLINNNQIIEWREYLFLLIKYYTIFCYQNYRRNARTIQTHKAKGGLVEMIDIFEVAMVERRITGDPTSEITTESITVETPEDELTIENVEMTDMVVQ